MSLLDGLTRWRRARSGVLARLAGAEVAEAHDDVVGHPRGPLRKRDADVEVVRVAVGAPDPGLVRPRPARQETPLVIRAAGDDPEPRRELAVVRRSGDHGAVAAEVDVAEVEAVRETVEDAVDLPFGQPAPVGSAGARGEPGEGGRAQRDRRCRSQQPPHRTDPTTPRTAEATAPRGDAEP